MKNFQFYCVCDESGIVSMVNERYETLKGVFSDIKDAKKSVETASEKYPHVNFEIVKVNIVEAD